MQLRQFWKLWVLLFTLSAAGCATVGHSQAGIDNFDQVSPDLFRGAQPAETGMATLAEHHIQTVINLRDGDDAAEAKYVREAGMTYIHMPLDAETVTVADAEKFLTILAEAKGPVFVHCLVGRDRTGMAVAAYRLRVQGWTLAAAEKDLIDHGHFWVFFPKVRAAIEQLATTKAPLSAVTPLALNSQARETLTASAALSPTGTP